MKNEKNVNYKDIGSVLYRKNNKARNISIRINSHGEVKVTVPGWCSFHRAESFVFEKRSWISSKLLKIERKTRENLVWKAGDQLVFRTGTISILAGEGAQFRVSAENGNYTLYLAADYRPENKVQAEAVMELLARIGQREAKRQLPLILKACAERHGLSYEHVTVRRMRTRWGSCSSKNRISLSTALIFLPDELIEYVCLHELAHTIHKNHSPAFWHALEGFLPGAMGLRKRLREQTIIA